MGSSSRLTITVLALLVICLFGLPVQGALYSGGGTEADPYIIDTAAKMNDIGANPGDWGSYFLLTADIDLGGYTGTSFNIIGPDWTTPFTGVFDGNSHTISNFTYQSSGKNYIGLFGYVKNTNAVIKDLTLIDSNIDAGTVHMYAVGSLVGQLQDGTVIDCNSVGGSVSGVGEVGGLIGYNYGGMISDCYAETIVSGNWRTGGLVGFNWYGTIKRCHAATSVSGISGLAGGLVSANSLGRIENCYATGSVHGSNNVGGLVGGNEDGVISNCYATGAVDGNDSVGGLVGTIWSGAISNCYSTGSVSGSFNLGGLVGQDSSGSVSASFWGVNSSGQASSSGGTGKTTALMQTESTFTDVGWDFVDEIINGTDDIWDICEGTNYPKLAWQIPLLGEIGRAHV